MEVVCRRERLEGFMHFAEFADAIDKLLGEAGRWVSSLEN